ncbi:DUF3226 domain-containing protein [Zavarzinella formosa]|uniref:DUF3226 domain-containing protein n=1 Tax=Zavarzinella formosa TaxID=360055 RepID=UPI0003673DEF|nr:DUF3226 domain-containing protein [Zavarzinella formosa]
MPPPNPKRLLVEGDEDKRIIPQFMEYFTPWGNTKNTWPLEIVSCDGVENLLSPGNLTVEFKQNHVEILGVIVDANGDPQARWAAIRNDVIDELPEIPVELPREGLVLQKGKKKFGVWLMPDNRSTGMIETFLSLFIKDTDKGLWKHVDEFCSKARSEHKACYKPAHYDKVKIHAWLAVQDPPGCQLQVAVTAKVLEPISPYADAFAEWFCKLFNLPCTKKT